MIIRRNNLMNNISIYHVLKDRLVGCLNTILFAILFIPQLAESWKMVLLYYYLHTALW